MYDKKKIVPIPLDSIEKMYCKLYPKEGTKIHKALGSEFEFPYQTLLGELMHVYMTCYPDIGYAVTTLSNF